MEFQKERCYSALNADELKTGDKVIVGASLLELKGRVEADRCCGKITEIGGECTIRRFAVDDVDGRGETYWELAYLVERAENCTNCDNFLSSSDGECSCKISPRFVEYRDKPIDVIRCGNYKAEPKTEKCNPCLMNEVCSEKVKELYKDAPCPYFSTEKKYRPFRDCDELIKVWDEKTKPYRADTKLPPIIMPLIWVQDKETGKRFALAELDERILGYLFDHCTFLDGSTCGVEE